MSFTKMYDSDADVYKGVHDPGLIVATDHGRLAKPTGATGIAWTVFSGNNKNGFGPNDRRNVMRSANPDRPGYNMVHMVMQRREAAGGYNPGLPQSGGVWPWHGARGGIYNLGGMTRNFMLEAIVRLNLGQWSKNALMSWPVDGSTSKYYNELDWEEVWNNGSGMGNNGKTTIWYANAGGRQQGPFTWSRPPTNWQAQWHLIRAVRLSTGIKQWVGNPDGTGMALVADTTTKSYNPILNASDKLMTFAPFSFALAQFSLASHSIYDQTVDKTGYFDFSRVRISKATLDTPWSAVPTGAIGDPTDPGPPQNVPTKPPAIAAESTGQTTVHVHWSASDSNGASPLAGYQAQQAPVTGTTIGTWAFLNGGATIVQQQFDPSGLTAGNKYAYRVRAINANGLTSDWSDVVQVQTDTAAPGTPAPVAYLIITSDDGMDSSEAGQLIVDAPFNYLIDPTHSTGTVNQITLTQSFNGQTPTSIYQGAMPTDPISGQFVDPGSYEVVLTATDVATSRSSTTRLTVVVADPQAQNENSSPNLRLPYVAEGQQPSAAWARQLIDALDALPSLMAYRFGEYNADDPVGISFKKPDEDFARIQITTDGIYFGDGTIDPLTTTPQSAPPTATTPPVQNVSVDYVNSSEAESSAGSANPAIVLPAGIPAGSYAVVGIISKLSYADLTPPAGWTVLAQGHHLNGSTKFHVIGKAVGTADSSTTVTITQGSAMWISEAYIAKGTTAVDDVDIFVPSVSTAASSLPAPVLQTNYSNELLLAIWAGRGTSNGVALNITPPSSMNIRQQDSTNASGATNMGMTMADTRIASPSANATVDNADSGGMNCFAMCVLVAFKPTTP